MNMESDALKVATQWNLGDDDVRAQTRPARVVVLARMWYNEAINS